MKRKERSSGSHLGCDEIESDGTYNPCVHLRAWWNALTHVSIAAENYERRDKRTTDKRTFDPTIIAESNVIDGTVHRLVAARDPGSNKLVMDRKVVRKLKRHPEYSNYFLGCNGQVHLTLNREPFASGTYGSAFNGTIKSNNNVQKPVVIKVSRHDNKTTKSGLPKEVHEDHAMRTVIMECLVHDMLHCAMKEDEAQGIEWPVRVPRLEFVGEFEGRIYIVMEPVNGVTIYRGLGERMIKKISRKGVPYAQGRPVKFMVETMDAVARFCDLMYTRHFDLCFMHRDLHLNNIMISRERERKVFYCIDFGMATMKIRVNDHDYWVNKYNAVYPLLTASANQSARSSQIQIPKIVFNPTHELHFLMCAFLHETLILMKSRKYHVGACEEIIHHIMKYNNSFGNRVLFESYKMIPSLESIAKSILNMKENTKSSDKIAQKLKKKEEEFQKGFSILSRTKYRQLSLIFDNRYLPTNIRQWCNDMRMMLPNQ